MTKHIEMLKESPDQGIKIELVKKPIPIVRVVDTTAIHEINIKTSLFDQTWASVSKSVL
jgi:hypothetical protein